MFINLLIMCLSQRSRSRPRRFKRLFTQRGGVGVGWGLNHNQILLSSFIVVPYEEGVGVCSHRPKNDRGPVSPSPLEQNHLE